MATPAHCLFCFEVLAAHLQDRTPMTLYQVETSWAEYPKGLESEDEAEADDEVNGTGASSADDDDDDESLAAAEGTSESASKRLKSSHPTIDRLRAQTASTSSNASASSTSLTEASSSSAASSPSTLPTSTGSSTSSFTPPGIARRTSQRDSSLTSMPLFVTWNKMSSSGGRNLRGCIGTFEAQPLANGLSTYALMASLSDVRFSPVTLKELPLLEVGVTLLTDFEDCADPMDWTLGVHGLRISFYHHHRRYGSTYLPDVAVEQGWTKEETLVSLMRKAGWLGRKEKWREVSSLKVVRYQGKVETVEYEEYERWKAWIDGKKK